VRVLTLVAIALLAAPAALSAQEEGGSMSMEPEAGPHLTVTPRWAEQPGDRERADSLVTVARRALERFRDVSAAEAAGYHRFAPGARRPRVYHYVNRAAGLMARFRFDPARPTALLYRPDGSGGLELLGAMYTMPDGASLEQLNRRIPLSVGQWHQHTNICVPVRRGEGSLALLRLATRDDCRAAGGRFRERSAWMIHVNLFAADSQEIWPVHGGMRRH
jgi:Ni/Co efflux regulator RcnB